MLISKHPDRLERTQLLKFELRQLLDGLRGRGFRLNFGDDGSGFLIKCWERGGGYYLGMLFIFNI